MASTKSAGEPRLSPGEARVAMLGNCQCLYMANLLTWAAPGVRAVAVAPHRHGLRGETRAWTRSADAVVDQVSPFETDIDFDFGPPAVKLPNTVVTYLWPNTAQERSANEVAWKTFGPRGLLNVNVVDQRMHDCVVEAATADEALARYLALDVAGDAKVHRLKAFNMAQVAHVGELTGIDIAGPIEAHMRTERLFHIYGHPAARIAGMLFSHILDGLGAFAPHITDRIDPEAVQTRIAALDGLHNNKPQAPVHPSVAAHFGLEWVDRPSAVHPRFGLMTNAEYIAALVRTEFAFRVLSEPLASPAPVLAALEAHPAPQVVLFHAVRRLMAEGWSAEAAELLTRNEPLIADLEAPAAAKLAVRLVKAQMSDFAFRVMELRPIPADLAEPTREMIYMRDLKARLGARELRMARRAAMGRTGAQAPAA